MMMARVLLRSVARRGSSIVPRRNFSSSPSITRFTNDLLNPRLVHFVALAAGYGTARWIDRGRNKSGQAVAKDVSCQCKCQCQKCRG